LLAAVAAGHTILAPNVELAAAVFDAVEREFRCAGRDIWPTPHVRDFSSWLREQYAQRQLLGGNWLRCLTDVEERELWREVIDASERGRDFLDPAAAAGAARRARRAVLEYGIPLRAVANDPSEESQAFLQWNRTFEQRCRDLSCVSADMLLGGMQGAQRPITWIESPVWRPMARQWLAQHGHVLEPQRTAATSAKRFHAASPAAELSAIADWARLSLVADERFRAWICVPDLRRRRAEVQGAMDAALAPRRFSLQADPGAAPYAVAGGTALADYAPVRAALDTLAASLGPVPFVRFSALLRAPEFQASQADASAAALLDIALRRRARSEADLESWLDLADRVAAGEELGIVAAAQRLRASRRALAQQHGSHNLSEWVRAWIAALEAGPWALRARWSSVEFQAAEAFRELLAALATADAVFGAHSQESAQRVLHHAARDTAFQTQTGVPAVWVSGQLLDPWLNYDGLWISGCGDNQWPPPVEPIPLLPVRLQRDYGVISAAAETQLEFASDLQSRWQSRALECVFSHADPADGSLSAPSPLLRDAVSPYSPRLETVAQPHWRALFDAAPALERFSDELAPPFAAGERTRGVATLRAQSRCAFRGFAETRLRAQPLEEPTPGFNEFERGRLVHEALQFIWSNLMNSNALLMLAPQAQQQLLGEAADRALALVCRTRDPGPRWRSRERVRLRSVLEKWLDVERRRAPFAVESLEEGEQPANFAGLEFRVRIDRVDRLLADGARVLIDYKTGSADPDWRGDRPDNPQLPIYALLRPEALIAVAYGKVSAGDPGFVAEAERGEIFTPSPRKSSLEGMPSFAALVNLWSQRVTRLAEEFAAGRAEVAPTLQACRRCHLHGLCRVPAALEQEGEFE